jgi:hypothetical protein
MQDAPIKKKTRTEKENEELTQDIYNVYDAETARRHYAESGRKKNLSQYDGEPQD